MDLDLAHLSHGNPPAVYTTRPHSCSTRFPSTSAERGIAPPGGWWLATTNRWRTTEHSLPTTCAVRPNLSSAAGSEDEEERTPPRIRSSSPPSGNGGQRHVGPLSAQNKYLFHLHLGACIFQLLLRRVGVRFVDAFLDRLGRSVDQILGFLQAQPGDFAHRLDDVHLVVADGGQHHGELGLFFRGRR